MVSYSNTGYENDFFDVSEVYFNSTPQSSSSSAVDLDELDARYLLKSGGTVSSNLIVSGSVDVKTALTLPTIGNVKDAIQGKQDTIEDGDLTIANTSGLQTTLDDKQRATTNTIIVNVGDNLKDTINNMGVNDTLKVSGGTFTDNISISTNSGTRTQGNVVGEKNKTILSGNLTIRSGVLFSLTNFKITGNTYVNNNTIFLPFESINQSFTNCEFKMIELRGGNQTLTFTDCKINNSFRSLNARISGIINFIRCDFTGSSFNLLHPENKNAIVMTDCIGLPDDVALDTQNYTVKGITGYTTKIGAFLSHSYTANETPTLTNELSSKSYVDSQVGTKQPTIEDGDLTIANTNGLQIALNNKQDTIEDGNLTIAFTDGLQTALDNKYDDTGGTISGSVNITSDLVVGTTNIITEIGTIQQNNVIFNSNEYGLKSVSNWVSQTAPSSNNFLEVVFASELNLFVAISGSFSGNRIITSSNGIDWEESISHPNTHLAEIAWSPELSLFVVVFTTAPCVATSPDGKKLDEFTL